MEFGLGVLRSLARTRDDRVEAALAANRIEPRIPLQNLITEEAFFDDPFEEFEGRRVLIQPRQIAGHEVHAFGIERA